MKKTVPIFSRRLTVIAAVFTLGVVLFAIPPRQASAANFQFALNTGSVGVGIGVGDPGYVAYPSPVVVVGPRYLPPPPPPRFYPRPYPGPYPRPYPPYPRPYPGPHPRPYPGPHPGPHPGAPHPGGPRF